MTRSLSSHSNLDTFRDEAKRADRVRLFLDKSVHRYGTNPSTTAERPDLSAEQQFIAASLAGDLAGIRRLIEGHPEFLRRPDAMFAAIARGRLDIAGALLDLGMSVNVGDDRNFRALRYTTHCGAAEIARMLIKRGAA